MWMFTVARNVLRTHWRSERRRTDATTALGNELRRKAMVDEATSLDERLDVRSAVRALPAPLREPLILVLWDGFTLEEAARHLGVNASTLRSRYVAARHAVAEHISVNVEEISESQKEI